MTKLHFIMAAAAALMLASPLSAQVGSLSDGSLLDNQTQTAPAQAAGEETSSEKIGDWDLQCALSGPEPRPCRMYQLLTDPQGNAVAEVTMYRLPEGAPAAAGATFIVPLQTLLPQQLTIALDGVLANRIPYTYCTQIGCLARLGISSIEAEAYKKGQNVTVSLVPAVAPDQVVSVNMSLKGFTEAFEKSTPVQQ
ncbi:invasion associated locus B family protein [uncultured Shimia sp.]|uniref:invasion associated locus B family protein n=1 Tax=uncultured Shimia sp. TaxID=573152 RepID=UPI00261C5B47|nr:invasion associated locus B family protein [uncultured Shimia sp.]